MNQFPLIVLLCAQPALVGLLATPFVARLLAGHIRPALWLAGVVGWTTVSSLAYAAWYEHALSREITSGTPGPIHQDGVFMILGFLFWNGTLIVVANAAAALVALVARRRR
jgi:hypothetical protein